MQCQIVSFVYVESQLLFRCHFSDSNVIDKASLKTVMSYLSFMSLFLFYFIFFFFCTSINLRSTLTFKALSISLPNSFPRRNVLGSYIFDSNSFGIIQMSEFKLDQKDLHIANIMFTLYEF